MDFIYKIIDIYLNFFIGFFDIFLRHSTAQVFGTFTALLYPLYTTTVLMWLTAGGTYLEDIDKSERVILTIIFSFMTTAMIHLFRGFGEVEMSSGYLILAYFINLGTALSYRFNITVIADGIDRHDKKY